MNPPQGLQIATPTDTTIVLTRTFNAPRRLVWEATFSPDKMRRWMMPPPGWSLGVVECDARVGGALKVVFKDDAAGSVMTLQGKFTEVVLHERATHTEAMTMGDTPMGSQVETHAFAEKGGVTTMTITQVHESKEARDGALASGMDEGMEACYKRLDAVLAQPG